LSPSGSRGGQEKKTEKNDTKPPLTAEAIKQVDRAEVPTKKGKKEPEKTSGEVEHDKKLRAIDWGECNNKSIK